ncbi:MAG: NmrA/HSCARG family protein [bacterium]|nr:NmrA/HSCARG family protein [bacterium]
MNDLILVTGATGQQGGIVARHLLKQGQKVRAFTRSPHKAEELKKLGAEVVQGDLLNRASIDAALKGVKRMFLVTTPYEAGVETETQQGINGVEAAAAAGVDHLVFSSVGSAQRNTGIPHFESKWKVEQRISKLGLKTTILRPVFFMENFGFPWFLPTLKTGTFGMPLPANRKLAMVSVENIGEFGAQAFIHPDKYIGAEIELAGDDLTIPNALELISKATGKTYHYQQLPHEGADKIYGDDFAIMFKWFDEVGYNPDFAGLKSKYGIRLIPFAEYLKTADWLKEL